MHHGTTGDLRQFNRGDLERERGRVLGFERDADLGQLLQHQCHGRRQERLTQTTDRFFGLVVKLAPQNLPDLEPTVQGGAKDIDAVGCKMRQVHAVVNQPLDNRKSGGGVPS